MQPDDPQNASPTPPAPTPTIEPAGQVHDYLHPIIDKPKRTYHPKVFVTILIVVVALSLLGVGLAVTAALLPTPTKQSSTQATDSKLSSNAEVLSATKQIDRVKAAFNGNATALSGLTTPVKTAKNNYYTIIPDLEPVVSIAGQVEPSKVQTTITSIAKVLTGSSMNERVLSDGSGTSSFLADYTHKDVVCQVASVRPADVASPQFVEAKCINMSSYEDYAAAQRPFYNIYSPAQAASTEVAFTGKAEVKPSATSGYQLAELPADTVSNGRVVSVGARAMFYQTPAGIWYYFKTRAQQLIECEQYSNDTLKFAYANQPCRSLAKDADLTVVPPKKK